MKKLRRLDWIVETLTHGNKMQQIGPIIAITWAINLGWICAHSFRAASGKRPHESVAKLPTPDRPNGQVLTRASPGNGRSMLTGRKGIRT
jgi:hypothetical protein